MRPTRRRFLLGGSSALILGSPRLCRAAPMPRIPAELYAPGVEAMAATVRTIVDFMKPSLVGVDFADLRSVLENGGRGGFGQATSVSRPVPPGQPHPLHVPQPSAPLRAAGPRRRSPPAG